MVIAFVMCILSFFEHTGKAERKYFISWGMCILISGITAVLLTMRGAGVMDYKCTIAVNELWVIWALLCMGGRRREGK